MSFDAALFWVHTRSTTSQFKRKDSWGLYTEDKEDAYLMALALGGFAEPIDEAYIRQGFYHHYHTSDRKLDEYYKKFHVWYWSLIGGGIDGGLLSYRLGFEGFGRNTDGRAI